MMRYILFTVFLSFSLSTFAQTAEPVFLTHVQLEWLDREINKYDSALENLQSAVDSGDKLAINKYQNAIEKSLRSFDYNGQMIYDKIANSLEPYRIAEMKNTILDGNLVQYDVYLQNQRKIKNAQEILLTLDQADFFNTNLRSTKAVYERFSKASSKSVEDKTSAESIKQLIEVQDFMNANNELLHKNYVKV